MSQLLEFTIVKQSARETRVQVRLNGAPLKISEKGQYLVFPDRSFPWFERLVREGGIRTGDRIRVHSEEEVEEGHSNEYATTGFAIDPYAEYADQDDGDDDGDDDDDDEDGPVYRFSQQILEVAHATLRNREIWTFASDTSGPIQMSITDPGAADEAGE